MNQLVKQIIRMLRSSFKGTFIERLHLTRHLYHFVTRRLIGSGCQLEYRGIKLEIDPKDQSMSSSLRAGIYETDELDVWSGWVRPNDVIFDIGANLGLYSLLSARLQGNQGRVIAFEPHPRAVALLRTNLALNDCSSVEIVESALGQTNGEIVLYSDPDALGSSSTVLTAPMSFVSSVVTLDSYCNEHQIYPDLIKVDIEGGEWPCMLGGEEAFARARKVLLEFNRPLLTAGGADVNAFWKYLTNKFAVIEKVDSQNRTQRLFKLEQIGNNELASLILSH